MNIKTKLVALGAIGAAAFGVAKAIRGRKPASQDLDSRFDLGDLEEPVIVTEEVIVISEATPYVDFELIPADSIGR